MKIRTTYTSLFLATPLAGCTSENEQKTDNPQDSGGTDNANVAPLRQTSGRRPYLTASSKLPVKNHE